MALNLQNAAPAQRPAPIPVKAPAKAAPKASANVAALAPTAPMTGPQLVAAATALTNSQTQGPLAQLASQISAQNQQTASAAKLTAAQFNELGKYIKGNNQAVASDAANLNGKLGTIATGLNQGLGAIQTGAVNATNAYAPKGDGDVVASGQQALVGALAQQQGLAKTNMGAFKAEGAEQGTTAKELGSNLGSAYIKGGQEALGTIRAAGQEAVAPLTSKVASDESTREADYGTNLVKLRQQELTNNQDNAALGIKQQTVNTTANNDAAKNKTDWENALTGANKASATAAYQQGLLGIDNKKANAQANYQSGELGVAQSKAATAASEAKSLNAYRSAEAAADRVKASGVPTPLATSSNNTMLDELGKAVAAAKQLRKTQTPQQIQSALTAGNAQLGINGSKTATNPSGVYYTKVGALPAPLVQAALEINSGGAISHQTWVGLHQMGIHSLPFKVAPPKAK